MPLLGIIDYGMGNLHSIARAFERVADDWRVEVSADPDRLRQMDKLVLPGVGAIRHCMEELQRLELDEFLREEIGQKTPLFGVCLGMQALLTHSAENGGVAGFGVFPGMVRHFTDHPAGAPAKIPHMGWNRVHQTIPHHPMFDGIEAGAWFYFVHSFYVSLDENQAYLAAKSNYQGEFAAMLMKEGVFAAQCHPEKSQVAGLQLLSNFLAWDGSI